MGFGPTQRGPTLFKLDVRMQLKNAITIEHTTAGMDNYMLFWNTDMRRVGSAVHMHSTKRVYIYTYKGRPRAWESLHSLQ